MKRLYSIDVLRGMALAGMILVNNPGSWSHIYPPLEHAPFAGLTLADLVFPTFIFVMGFCIPLSMRKYDFQPSGTAILRIARRTLLIFGVGLLLQWMSSGWCRWDELRIPGVLQRLALCYGVCASLLLISRRLCSMSLSVLILLSYSLLLYFGQGHEWSEANLVARLDHRLLGSGHLYVDEGIRLDPEGILSTLPSVVHVMLGSIFSLLFIGQKRLNPFRWWHQPKTPASVAAPMSSEAQVRYLLGQAFSMGIIAIELHNSGFPIIKKVWSSTFVLATIAIASLVLALLIWQVEIKQWRGWWSQWFVIFGRNSLLLYVISWILADWLGRCGITWGIYAWLARWCQPCLASLLYAMLFVLLNWLIAFGLYKGKVRVCA